MCVVKRLHQSLDEKHIDAHPTAITGFASYIHIYCPMQHYSLVSLCVDRRLLSVSMLSTFSHPTTSTHWMRMSSSSTSLSLSSLLFYLIIIILCSNGKSPLHRACDNRFTEREVAEQCLVRYFNFS